jgi:inorganic triphosphatase YgiF
MGMEIERQWLAPDDVVLPDAVGPFSGEDVEQREIVDTYLDTADRSIREGGGRLRLRTQNGRRLATFKQSLAGPGDGVRRREEIESEVGDDPEESEAFVEARAHSPHPLVEVGTLHTTRAARIYRSGELVVEAVVDRLRYPDGSSETRVEAEGDEQSVLAFSPELERALPGLSPAATTKGAELARRLGPSA